MVDENVINSVNQIKKDNQSEKEVMKPKTSD